MVLDAEATPPLAASATLTLEAELTVRCSALLVEAALYASPPQLARMLCPPTARPEVVHAALAADKATALQPAIVLPSALKATSPVGALPATVAVKVTEVPAVEGFCELCSVVVVGETPLTPNAVSIPFSSVTYTMPLATIGLSQCVPPTMLVVHSRLPVVGEYALSWPPAVVGPKKNKTLLASSGEDCACCEDSCHCATSDGWPPLSNESFRPESPPLLPTKTQVVPSAGLTHTAGWARSSPPWGMRMGVATSPPVCPGAPLPLRLARLTRRNCASLPPWTARWATAELAGTGRMAGEVLPRSASRLSRFW